MTNKKLAIILLISVATTLFLITSCTRIPFLPRLEIDSFAENNDSLETMEVKGVIYTHVINPQANADPTAPPAIWVPAQVYQGGNYRAYTADLPKTATTTTESAGNSLSGDQGSEGELGYSSTSVAVAKDEEQLVELSAKILPLRRRALLFPSRTSLQHPEITTLLNLELENKLPLRVVDCHDQTLLDQGRLINQRPEITAAIKTWLNESLELPQFHFIIFVTTSSGRDYQYYTCSWVDAQTGANIASFSFRENLKGQLLRPLVPNNPTPLLNLVNATPWWCKIIKGDPENSYQLDAGHRSDLRYGRKLQVFHQATPIKDPQDNKLLGFNFSKPLGVISVVDFFGDDSSIGQALSPQSSNFDRAYAVEITEFEKDITEE